MSNSQCAQNVTEYVSQSVALILSTMYTNCFYPIPEECMEMTLRTYFDLILNGFNMLCLITSQ
jgi:hypothetical protein